MSFFSFNTILYITCFLWFIIAGIDLHRISSPVPCKPGRACYHPLIPGDVEPALNVRLYIAKLTNDDDTEEEEFDSNSIGFYYPHTPTCEFQVNASSLTDIFPCSVQIPEYGRRQDSAARAIRGKIVVEWINGNDDNNNNNNNNTALPMQIWESGVWLTELRRAKRISSDTREYRHLLGGDKKIEIDADETVQLHSTSKSLEISSSPLEEGDIIIPYFKYRSTPLLIRYVSSSVPTPNPKTKVVFDQQRKKYLPNIDIDDISLRKSDYIQLGPESNRPPVTIYIR